MEVNTLLWRNHFLAGFAAGILVTGWAHGAPQLWLAGAVSGAAALVPDLDSPRSRLGKKVAPVSWTAGRLFGHRGVTHSLAGWAAAVFLFGLAVRQAAGRLPWHAPWTGWSFLVPLFATGYLSHILTDCLTIEGCPVLWPSSRRFRLPLMTTGSPLGETVATLAGVGLILFLLAGR